MRGQSRRMSVVESVLDTLSSFFLGVAVNYWLAMPYLNVVPTFWTAAGMTIFFMIPSILRRYLWRRLFNWLDLKGRW